MVVTIAAPGTDGPWGFFMRGMPVLRLSLPGRNLRSRRCGNVAAGYFHDEEAAGLGASSAGRAGHSNRRKAGAKESFAGRCPRPAAGLRAALAPGPAIAQWRFARAPGAAPGSAC